MSYEVRLNRAAEHDLDRLAPEMERRVIARVEALAQNPRPPGSAALVGTLEGLRRLRVGDYRVSYVVDDEARVVTVVEIGHRRNVDRRAGRRRR